MTYRPYLIAASLAGLFTLSAPAFGQSATPTHPHVIVVKLVQRAGPMPFAFDPSNITAQRGDTLHFVNDVMVMHNVHFKTHPAGAKLGTTVAGPYLTSKGDMYNVVIDGRFTDGKYEFVCDPHEAIGMHGMLTVVESTLTVAGNK